MPWLHIWNKIISKLFQPLSTSVWNNAATIFIPPIHHFISGNKDRKEQQKYNYKYQLCTNRYKCLHDMALDWLEMTGMSFSIPIFPVPNGSFPFSFPLPGLARFYSNSLPSAIGYSPSAASPISSHLLLFFIDIVITSKLRTNGIL